LHIVTGAADKINRSEASMPNHPRVAIGSGDLANLGMSHDYQGLGRIVGRTRDGRGRAGPMEWNDRVYGEVRITDPAILALIESPTFQRLSGIRQAGPSAIAFAFKDVTRFEHSLGVYLLLVRLGARVVEQVAGLLHDISHTAFSHAVDFLVTSDEQDHHESLKPVMLDRPDVAGALERLGFRPGDFYDDARFPLLERPLPWLCADRLDYFLRDGLACRVLTPRESARILGHLTVIDSTIVFTDLAVAREATARFDEMNRNWWASPTEAFIYNEFADALREGFRLRAIIEDDLLTEDDLVLTKLEAASSPLIAEKLAVIRDFHAGRTVGYSPRVIPKERWLDPPVQTGWTFRRMSELA
jgi:hypothetical protein